MSLWTILYFFVKLFIIIALIAGIVLLAVGYAIDVIKDEIESTVSDVTFGIF